MNKMVQELAAICKEHRFDEKLLFVPSYAIGHQIGESLAKAGHAWINLRPTTLSGYAQGLVGIDLARDGIRLIDSKERLLIVEEIFRRDEKLNGPGSYFAGSSGIPGILKCLAGSVHELRMEGFAPDDLANPCFLVPAKSKALKRLLSVYEEFLTDNQLPDQAGLITLACEMLKEGKVKASLEIVLILSGFALSKIEKDFVLLVAGENLISVGHEPVRGIKYPKRFSGTPGTVLSNPKTVRSDYSGRRNHFLVGLDQAGFPGPLLQDPILLDRERKSLGEGLPLSHERMDEDLYTMTNGLSSLQGRVTLSYSCHDLREDREMFPSALVLGVYRLISGKRGGDYSDLKQFLGKPAGFISNSLSTSLL